MFKVRKAESGDVDTAIAALGDAFAQDPRMLYLFHESPEGARAGAMGFFSMLLRARIALDMPAYVLTQGDDVLGAVMGYDTSRPEWPAALADEMRRFEAEVPGFAARLDAYAKICEAHQPGEDHYYLGVIGVHSSLQGNGAGKPCSTPFAPPRARIRNRTASILRPPVRAASSSTTRTGLNSGAKAASTRRLYGVSTSGRSGDR